MTPDDIRRIEGRLDDLNNGQIAVIRHLERLNNSTEKVAERVSQLELWKARVEGAGTALKAQWPILVVGVSVATAVIVKIL